MTTFLEAIEAAKATLPALPEATGNALGYGTDLSCVTDVTEDFAEVDPFSVQAIRESAIRRLSTDRGELPESGDPEDADYGFNLRRLLNSPTTESALAEVESRASGEVEKDPRVKSAVVTLTRLAANRMRVSLTITPEDPRLTTFESAFELTTEGLALL